MLESHPGPLVLPTLVITEVVYLIGTRLGWEAEVRFLGDLAAGTVDASVIVTAERLDATEVATLDRRHFSVVRPKHEVAFQLLP